MARPSIFAHGTRRDLLDNEHLSLDLGTRSVGGALFAFGGQGAGILIQLANVYVLARLLVPDDYGIYALAMIIVGFTGIFTDFGLSVAAIQMEKLDQNVASGLFFMNVALGTGAMIVCLIGAPIFGWYFDQPAVFWAIVALAIAIPFSAATVQYNALLSRGMRWREIQIVLIVSQLAGFASGAVSARYGAGYMSLVIAANVQILVKLVLAVWLSHWRPSLVTNWNACWGAVRFGAYYTGFTLCNFLHKQADVFLIGNYWGVRETGYYNRAYQLMALPLNAVSGPLGSVFLPALSRLQGDPPRWGRAFVRATLMTSLLGCAAAAALFASADPIIRIVLGPGWDETGRLFAWLSLSMIVTFPMGAASWAFTSLGRTKAFFHWGLLSTGALVIAFAAAAPFGAVRVAQAYSGMVFLLTPVCFVMALKGSGLKAFTVLGELMPVWLAAVLAGVIGRAILVSTPWLIFDVTLRTIVTLGCYAIVLAPFFFWRQSYRQLREEAWGLTRRLSRL
ncbi:lipopolysaccharide biosynthesis protein [Phenylobacterium sp.]|uniref:lipopolysaccharide biosynthesis protein n=1 Tax=Phenylobacterium sp. TaxID=1871053 RepID=UPI002737EF31|nr:lipopolysaccharide biosynthesis protein [Phenylobacterium sp.]MDP3868375.1 lipopolysaccharide biosynthesis protein [Phenylobacterium sp.]